MIKPQDIARRIIEEQERIIGPLAWNEAKHVEGIIIDGKNIRLGKDVKNILEALVTKYQNLFGDASLEVCRQAVHGFIDDLPEEMIPSILS